MTQHQREAFRQQLLTLRGRLTGDVADMTHEALHNAGGEASGGLSNTPIHMADLGSDAFEQEFTLGLIENQERALEEVDAALARVREGRFGACEECGQAIPADRLKALPYARHCVACARKLEQGA